MRVFYFSIQQFQASGFAKYNLMIILCLLIVGCSGRMDSSKLIDNRSDGLASTNEVVQFAASQAGCNYEHFIKTLSDQNQDVRLVQAFVGPIESYELTLCFSW